MTSAFEIEPLRLPFDARLNLPGSKSEANRLLVLAALSGGPTTIRGATLGDDVLYMFTGLESLGFDIDLMDAAAGHFEINGGVPDRGGQMEIFCGNAGTALRFLISIAALVPGEWTLHGDEHMSRRPIGPLVEAWKSLGLEIECNDGCPPVRLTGGHRKGGHLSLDSTVSSQFLTSLLLVAHRLEGGLEIELEGELASPDYVSLTFEKMRAFGLPCRRDGKRVIAQEGRPRTPKEIEVEGDWSSAGAFLALAELTSSRCQGANLKSASRQADRRLPELIARMRESGDLEIDVADTPDQLMNLAVLAAHRQGRTRFLGARNLRLKECDRLAVTARELARAGIEIEEEDDGLIVRGPGEPVPCSFDPEDDHRVAMALTLLGLTNEGFQLENRRCVEKSYPEFFRHIDELRDRHRCLVIVGMRAAGKSRLAAELGEHVGSRVIDTDTVFQDREGRITEFVAREGWPRFREIEASIVRDSLAPARIVALGGGALESEATRVLCTEEAVVIWIDESLERIRERVRKQGNRPALSGGDAYAELEEILERRRPQFTEVADLRVPPGLDTDEQVSLILEELQRRCSW